MESERSRFSIVQLGGLAERVDRFASDLHGAPPLLHTLYARARSDRQQRNRARRACGALSRKMQDAAGHGNRALVRVSQPAGGLCQPRARAFVGVLATVGSGVPVLVVMDGRM